MTEDQQSTTTGIPEDKMSPGLNVLSFFIPLIGAIIYFANKDQYPVKAKGIGRATLMGFVYSLVYIFLKASFSRGD